MEWSIPADVTELLGSVDEFIDGELAPIEAANPEFFGSPPRVLTDRRGAGRRQDERQRQGLDGQLRSNRLACDAADRAIQVHAGLGYTRHQPFEYIYRHHRRYRITEGSDELQLRRIAGRLFGVSDPRPPSR